MQMTSTLSISFLEIQVKPSELTLTFISQLIPEISSLSWFTTIVPLVLVLAITAVKDATDDYVSVSTYISTAAVIAQFLNRTSCF